jgi:hypothetical protein
MEAALNQSLCGCTQPWHIHQQIATYYTAVPERGLFIVTWWVRAHGLCRTQVVRLGQDNCLVCGQRRWCGRGEALHTWEYNAAPVTGSNQPAITVGGLGEAHAWSVAQVRTGQVPQARPSRLRRLLARARSQMSNEALPQTDEMDE